MFSDDLRCALSDKKKDLDTEDPTIGDLMSSIAASLLVSNKTKRRKKKDQIIDLDDDFPSVVDPLYLFGQLEQAENVGSGVAFVNETVENLNDIMKDNLKSFRNSNSNFDKAVTQQTFLSDDNSSAFKMLSDLETSVSEKVQTTVLNTQKNFMESLARRYHVLKQETKNVQSGIDKLKISEQTSPKREAFSDSSDEPTVISASPKKVASKIISDSSDEEETLRHSLKT